MTLEAKDLLAPLISIIVMFIPIGGLFWKFSRIVFQVEENKKDIDGLGSKMNHFINNQEKRFSELSAQMNDIATLLGRLEERFVIMDKTITEIKKEMVPREVLAGYMKNEKT
jgi:hypothetical protein